jgi:Uma2 family endonuclease
MTRAVTTETISLDDYLALERAGSIKHEYFQGEMTPMTGASRRHNLLVMALASSLYGQLRGQPCEVYASDMRVRTPSGLYTYPDVVVACGEPQFEDDQIDTLVTPTVLIEVLSKSTMAYDRGEKFEHYRAIASLTDYIMVAQDKVLVEHFVRQDDDFWLFSEARLLDQTVSIGSLGCTLSLDAIYERIQFS